MDFTAYYTMTLLIVMIYLFEPVFTLNRVFFSPRKMLSLTRESESWYANGILQSCTEQLYIIQCRKGSTIIPCIYALMTNKTQVNYRKNYTKVIEINLELSPFPSMVHFEKAAINECEEKFLCVVSG